MLRDVEPFRFDRSWHFPLPAEQFWSSIERVDDFPRWWGWLRSFRADGLVAGGRATFVVQSALPFQLHFDIDLIEVVAPRMVVAHVDGDLQGPARLIVEPDGDDSNVSLSWRLVPRDRMLRTMTSLSRPLMAWSHDQIVGLGLRQFRRQLLAEHRRAVTDVDPRGED